MERKSDYGNFAAGVELKIILIILILLALSELWSWFRPDPEEAEARIEKDEKYSFKKMNAEINQNKKMNDEGE